MRLTQFELEFEMAIDSATASPFLFLLLLWLSILLSVVVALLLCRRWVSIFWSSCSGRCRRLSNSRRSCDTSLHEVILVWHADKTWLILLLGHRTYTHHVDTHLRCTEHARWHELAWHLPVHLRHTSILKLLLLRDGHSVSIFSWLSCPIAAIHLLLHLSHLLQLHHVLLIDDHRDAIVSWLVQLSKLGHLTAVCKLIDVLLSRELRRLSPPLVVLNHLIQLQKSQRGRLKLG